MRRDGVRKNGEKFEELTGRFSWIKFCLLFGSPSICWIFQCVSTVNLSLNPFPRLWCVWLFSGCFNRYDSSHFWLIMANDRQKMVKSYCFWIKKCTKWKRKSSKKKKKKNPPFTPYSWLKKKNEWKVYKKNPVSYISQVKTKNIVKAIKQEEKIGETSAFPRLKSKTHSRRKSRSSTIPFSTTSEHQQQQQKGNMDQCSSLLVSALFSTIILSGLYNPVEGNETMKGVDISHKFQSPPSPHRHRLWQPGKPDFVCASLGLRGEQFGKSSFPRKPPSSQLATRQIFRPMTPVRSERGDFKRARCGVHISSGYTQPQWAGERRKSIFYRCALKMYDKTKKKKDKNEAWIKSKSSAKRILLWKTMFRWFWWVGERMRFNEYRNVNALSGMFIGSSNERLNRLMFSTWKIFFELRPRYD